MSHATVLTLKWAGEHLACSFRTWNPCSSWQDGECHRAEGEGGQQEHISCMGQKGKEVIENTDFKGVGAVV